MAVIRTELVRDLRELIAALDRRVPRVERAGEAAIAHDAAALKAKALRRIAQLERADAGASSGAQKRTKPKPSRRPSSV